MADVDHTLSVVERITAANKNTVDFAWFKYSSSCSLHHQEIMDGTARNVNEIPVPSWCKRKKYVTGGRKQQEGYKEEDENSVSHVSHLESNVSMFSCRTNDDDDDDDDDNNNDDVAAACCCCCSLMLLLLLAAAASDCCCLQLQLAAATCCCYLLLPLPAAVAADCC